MSCSISTRRWSARRSRPKRILSDIFGAFGHRLPIKDTRPWMTFTIDLWRLKNINASALYDICEAYATAAPRQARGLTV